MTSSSQLQRGLARQHVLLIVAIVVIGALAAFLILRTPVAQPAGDGHGHGDAHREAGHSHDEGEHEHGKDEHGDDEHAHPTAAAASGEAVAHEEAHDHAKDPHAHAAASGASAEAHGHDEAGHAHQDEHVHGTDTAHSDDKAHGDAKPKAAAADAHAEGERIALSDAQIKTASIALEQSAPANLQTRLSFPGEIRFDEDRSAHIVPRTAGVVEAVHVTLGQAVRKGQALAEVSSLAVSDLRAELMAARQRASLAQATYAREQQLWQEQISPEQDVQQARTALREAQISVRNAQQKLQTLGASESGAAGHMGRMTLRAPFDGVVVEKHLTLGEAVQDSTNAFTVADLSSVWAELKVPARHLDAVRVGEPVTVRSGASGQTATGRIAYVGMLIGEQTRTAPARVKLANPGQAWRPGLFVDVDVTTGDAKAPVTVSEAAVQTLDGKPTVFVRVPGGFVPQTVTLGRTGQGRVEVLQGLKAGDTVAGTGSFTVKAEQGKAQASHTH